MLSDQWQTTGNAITKIELNLNSWSFEQAHLIASGSQYTEKVEHVHIAWFFKNLGPTDCLSICERSFSQFICQHYNMHVFLPISDVKSTSHPRHLKWQHKN